MCAYEQSAHSRQTCACAAIHMRGVYEACGAVLKLCPRKARQRNDTQEMMQLQKVTARQEPLGQMRQDSASTDNKTVSTDLMRQ